MARFVNAEQAFYAQIAYAGPGVGGKTTNVVWISNQMQDGSLSKIATQGERTLLFDLKSLRERLTVADPAGGEPFGLKLNLVTVPGQIQYREARAMSLKNPDAIVFVADSRACRLGANRYAMDDLVRILVEHGRDPAEIPLVMQYNKRDLPDAMPVEELEETLNPFGAPSVRAIAVEGIGVFGTLGMAIELVQRRLASNLQSVAGR